MLGRFFVYLTSSNPRLAIVCSHVFIEKNFRLYRSTISSSCFLLSFPIMKKDLRTEFNFVSIVRSHYHRLTSLLSQVEFLTNKKY